MGSKCITAHHHVSLSPPRVDLHAERVVYPARHSRRYPTQQPTPSSCRHQGTSNFQCRSCPRRRLQPGSRRGIVQAAVCVRRRPRRTEYLYELLPWSEQGWRGLRARPRNDVLREPRTAIRYTIDRIGRWLWLHVHLRRRKTSATQTLLSQS
jgi:hypothetical protein